MTKTITLTSKYNKVQVKFRISADAYNKLAKTDADNRMPMIYEAFEYAKHGISTLLTPAQVKRANKAICGVDYYISVTL